MRNQIAAAERAGIHAVTVNSANTDDWSLVYGRSRRVGRRAARQPGAAEQPRVPRPGAPRALAHRRHAGGRRGALHLRLGARLPARLPPPAHADRRAARRRAGAGHHGHRERPRHHRRGRPARGEHRQRRGTGPARPARPRVAAPERAAPAPGRRPLRLARPAPRRPAGLGHRLHAHRQRGRRARGVPARARPPGRGVHGQDRPRRARARRGRPAVQPGQGPRRHECPGDGLRQARPRVRRAPRRPPVAGGLLPADRPGGPRGRARRGPAAARAGGPRHLGLLRLAGVPGRAAGPGRAGSSATLAARCPPPRSNRGSSSAAAAWR